MWKLQRFFILIVSFFLQKELLLTYHVLDGRECYKIRNTVGDGVAFLRRSLAQVRLINRSVLRQEYQK